jgi:DNA-binding NarL/FixJ family response regulator
MAANGGEAVELALKTEPDVVIMDVQMPVMDGIEATRRIVAEDPEVKILMLTMFEDDDSVLAAMRAGAHGYVLKGAEQDEIARAVQAVASGEAIFGAALAERLITYLSAAQESMQPFPELSDREREVLRLLADGLGNADIAQRLDVAPKTVRNNVSSILNKLQVVDRAQAIVRAREAGLGGR